MTKREAWKAAAAVMADTKTALEYWQKRGEKDGIAISCLYWDTYQWWIHSAATNKCGHGNTPEEAYLMLVEKYK